MFRLLSIPLYTSGVVFFSIFWGRYIYSAPFPTKRAQQKWLFERNLGLKTPSTSEVHVPLAWPSWHRVRLHLREPTKTGSWLIWYSKRGGWCMWLVYKQLCGRDLIWSWCKFPDNVHGHYGKSFISNFLFLFSSAFTIAVKQNKRKAFSHAPLLDITIWSKQKISKQLPEKS